MPKHAYNLSWPDGISPLEIELAMIRRGGRFELQGGQYGNGLFFHFRQAQTLLWPDEDHHRWSDLILKTVLEERLTVVQGSRDSSKTRTLAKYAITDYFVAPTETLILMSSTDIRGLELRVWGDLKSLWERAHDRFDFLPGFPLDSRHGIFTDDIGDDKDDRRIRDMRRGILCIPVLDSEGNETRALEKFVGVKQKRRRIVADECFPKGTLVDTPFGPKPIESIRTGDKIYSAAGMDIVVANREQNAASFAAVTMRDGRQIICTPEHPFATQQGWVSACKLNKTHYVFSAYEAMRNLWSTNGPWRTEKSAFEVLWKGLFRQMEETMVGAKSNPQGRNGGEDAGEQPNGESGHQGENDCQHPSHGLEASGARREWNGTNQSGSAVAPNVPAGPVELRNTHREEAGQRIPASIQSGPRLPRCQTCGGGRWTYAQQPVAASDGFKENRIATGSWVDRVEILEQTDPRFPLPDPDYRRCRVHNLQVAHHPSYSVNGLLVHNCQFLPISYLNILSNLDKAKSDFKAIFTGNPLGQKALDKVAEPECGWENMAEPQRTATWRNKFDGVTINLVGTDSPNYDADRPKNYDYLIGPEDAALVQKRYGPESIEFYSQIKGVRKSNLNARIVLTPDMCKRHGAFEHCIWGHEPITRVLGLDAGFGGDACETILLEYGKDVEGRQVVRFHEPQMIPISLSAPESPEDQIAKAAKVMLAQLGVPKSNLFFEAGMRATLAISLARIIGPEVNAVNAGGPATERPVSADLLVDDENGSNRKRLKRCDEHYSKFITECWFSVRLLVECGQAREFPQSVVKEFSEREWTYVRGDRYELETKDDFKQRCHYSPNKADAAAIGFEGVRRLGFEMGRPPEDNPLPEPDWLAAELDKHKREQRESELTYDT